jgi:hypothetical protein
MEKKKVLGKKMNKELIQKALTDPKFRKLLMKEPTKALNVKRVTKIQLREIELVLAAVKGIEAQMEALADELLCACSIATG